MKKLVSRSGKKSSKFLKRLSMAGVAFLVCLCLQQFITISEQNDKIVNDQILINGQLETIKQLNDSIDFYRGFLLKKQAEVDKKLAKVRKHKEFLHSEVKCLADNVYNEAAYEPKEGQLAVATVVMNRVKSKGYPNTICGVVYERHYVPQIGKIVCQFSWTCKPREPVFHTLYAKIYKLAREVYFKHDRASEVEDATLYHADYIPSPDWALKPVAQIGHHIFYQQ